MPRDWKQFLNDMIEAGKTEHPSFFPNRGDKCSQI